MGVEPYQFVAGCRSRNGSCGASAITAAPGENHARASSSPRIGADAHARLLRGRRVHRVRRHRIRGRTAICDGSHRSHPRHDSRTAPDVGNQARRARGDDLRQCAVRRVDGTTTLREINKVTFVEGASSANSSGFRAGAPDGRDRNRGRVTVANAPVRSCRRSRRVAAGAVVPALTGSNTRIGHCRGAQSASAWGLGSRRAARRADSARACRCEPRCRAARVISISSSAGSCAATPFPIDEAQVSHFRASATATP